MRIKDNIKRYAAVIASLPKSIYFNFRSLPPKQAIKLPFLVHYKYKILETHKGIIEFSDKVKEIRTFMIHFGFGGSRGIVVNGRGLICLEKGGKMIFDGSASFSPGCSFRVNGKLTFGDYFLANKNCFFSCSDEMTFGADIMLGWNISIRDSDGHPLYHNGELMPVTKPVKIGDHAWIASEAHILKGTELGDNCVVAYRSLVTKKFEGNNLLVGGSPAKLIAENVDHKH